MFCDKVASTWVKRTSQERAEDEIIQGLQCGPTKPIERIVESKLGDYIKKVDRGEGWGVNEHRSDRIKEDLEGAEEGFSQQRVEKKGLQGSREVCVK